MALPRYGSKDQSIPILDHRSMAAAAWPTAAHEEQVTGSPTARPDPDEPIVAKQLSSAERARTTISNARTGVLSLAGASASPLGLIVPYALRDNGIPLIGCRSGFTTVLGHDPQSGAPVSLAVTESPLTGSASTAGGGVTLLGVLRAIGEAHLKQALTEYAVAQPADAVSINNGAGQLMAIEPTSLWVTVADGGYEEIDIEAYGDSSADPLAHVAPTLVSHLSSDQGASLVLLCRAFGDQPGATAATLSGIDQNGMDLLVTTAHGRESVRIPFGQAVHTPEEVRKELSIMVRGARFKLGMG